jgi:hypothetical protein
LWVENEFGAELSVAGAETLPDDVTEIEHRRLIAECYRRQGRAGLPDVVITCAGKPNPLAVTNVLDGTVAGYLDLYELVVGDISRHQGPGQTFASRTESFE